MTGPSLADVCVVACAEAWRGDGEILASTVGLVPTLGARLARACFEPDLVLTDGEALLVADQLSTTDPAPAPVVEGWMPYRSVFDAAWSGRRHMMMGASQIDRHGNQNIACIGAWERPRAQLLGVRGAPGNTVNHPTSYWVTSHSPRSFVGRVDMVSGVGHERAVRTGPSASRFHEIRRVVSNLAVLDFQSPDHTMRLRSIHPGVTVDDVLAATGFPLTMADPVEETRGPTEEEARLLAEVLDPDGRREAEVRR